MRILIALLAVSAMAQQIDAPRQVKNLPHLDARTFGAKCDGVTDDTVAVQAAIDAAVTGEARRPVELCQDPFVITAPLTVYDTLDLTIGPHGGMARLIWQGANPDDSVFVLRNSKQFKLRNIEIESDTAFKNAVLVYTQDEVSGTSSYGTISNLRIEGRDLSTNGIALIQSSGIDKDNDSMRIEQVLVASMTGAGFFLQGANGFNHTLINCYSLRNNYGLRSIKGVPTNEISSFNWFGGLTIKSTTADFYLEGNTAQPISIRNVDSEGSPSFLYMPDSAMVFGGWCNLNVEAVRYSPYDLADDSAPAFKFGCLGPISLRNVNINMGLTDTHKMKVDWNYYGSPSDLFKNSLLLENFAIHSASSDTIEWTNKPATQLLNVQRCTGYGSGCDWMEGSSHVNYNALTSWKTATNTLTIGSPGPSAISSSSTTLPFYIYQGGTASTNLTASFYNKGIIANKYLKIGDDGEATAPCSGNCLWHKYYVGLTLRSGDKDTLSLLNGGAMIGENAVAKSYTAHVDNEATGGITTLGVRVGPGQSTNPVMRVDNRSDGAVLAIYSAGEIYQYGVLQAALPSSSDGTFVYCRDCKPGIAACAGSGTGTWAYHQGGAWDCSAGGGGKSVTLAGGESFTIKNSGGTNILSVSEAGVVTVSGTSNSFAIGTGGSFVVNNSSGSPALTIAADGATTLSGALSFTAAGLTASRPLRVNASNAVEAVKIDLGDSNYVTGSGLASGDVMSWNGVATIGRPIGTASGQIAAGDHAHTGVYSPVGHDHAGLYASKSVTTAGCATLAKLTTGGSNGSLCWNDDGQITSYTAPN